MLRRLEATNLPQYPLLHQEKQAMLLPPTPVVWHKGSPPRVGDEIGNKENRTQHLCLRGLTYLEWSKKFLPKGDVKNKGDLGGEQLRGGW